MTRVLSPLIDWTVGRRWAWLVCALILAASIGIIAGAGTPLVSNDPTSGLSAGPAIVHVLGERFWWPGSATARAQRAPSADAWPAVEQAVH